jgi:FtsH-binding integral membrane protein
MMEKPKVSPGDWLDVLTVIGRIMIFTPIIILIISILVSLFGPNINQDGLYSGTGSIFFCGLVTLIYVAIKRFKAGLKGKS